MTNNKVWTQSIRLKMASAVYEAVTKQVRRHWRKRFEEDDKTIEKRIKQEAKRIVRGIKTHTMEVDAKFQVFSETNSVEFNWLSSNTLENILKVRAMEATKSVDERLEEKGIPDGYWHSRTDTPGKCVELMKSDIDVLNDIGFTLLEFLRTGHFNEWTEVMSICRSYVKGYQKENK